jgi:hypothetical protein
MFSAEETRIHGLRKTILTAARLLKEELNPDGLHRWDGWMVGLTYAPANEWQPLHISQFLAAVRNRFRRKLKGRKLPYLWVSELQQRGAVHYHLVIFLPCGVKFPRPDKTGLWPHGNTSRELARNPYGYLAKYLSKMKQKEEDNFPKGLRLYGVGGVSKAGKAEIRWWHFPKWVRELWPKSFAENYRRGMEKGASKGFRNIETGEVVETKFAKPLLLKINGKAYTYHMQPDSGPVPEWVKQCKRASPQPKPEMVGFGFDLRQRWQASIEATYQKTHDWIKRNAPVFDWRSRGQWADMVAADNAPMNWSLPGWAGLEPF